MNQRVWLIGLFYILSFTQNVNAQQSKKIVCYHASWSYYRVSHGHFEVEDIDPYLCTHIIYSFVGINEDSTIRIRDPVHDLDENGGRGAMKRFTALKRLNPELRTLLAIGGWEEGSANFSIMARTQANRKAFIDNVIPFLQSQGFDGLDLDWEYPAHREGSIPEDKENFIHLINELRVEFDKHGFLLTAAVAATAWTIDAAYDVPAMSRGLDFINIMSYAFRGGATGKTAHHSPLYANPNIDFGNDALSNTNNSVIHLIESGAPREKLILGMATYGRGYILDDPNQNGLYDPASEPIPAGPYMRAAGTWTYFEICERMQNETGQWNVVKDEFYQTPYAYHGTYWIGYDSPDSVAIKSHYINQNGLGGGMFWTIEMDDFNALCGAGNFTLIRTVKRILGVCN